MNKIVAIVPAAGSGKRFSDEGPKQFLKISEKSILELSIRPLLDFSDCLGVCVVVPPEDQYHKSLDVIQNPKVFVVEGGSSRMKSVMNGIKFWEESDTSYDYILIHDAVRPCLRSSDVQEIINSLEEEIDGIVLGIPCSDSIKEVSGENSLNENIERVKGAGLTWEQLSDFNLKFDHADLFMDMRSPECIEQFDLEDWL